MKISLIVDGVAREDEVDPRTLLVQYLRDHLDLTGTKIGCDTGDCGSCTVDLNGESVKSCLVLAVQSDQKRVTTAQGLVVQEELHPLQRAFHEHHALQCGYCTSGMIMAGRDLLKRNPSPSAQQIRIALKGNLCRCTGYQNIIEAILAAAQEANSELPEGDSITPPPSIKP